MASGQGRRSSPIQLSPYKVSIFIWTLATIVQNLKGEPGVRICLRNCYQCRIMYGNVFFGQRCAEQCLILNKGYFLDCADIVQVIPFLRLDTSNKLILSYLSRGGKK